MSASNLLKDMFERGQFLENYLGQRSYVSGKMSWSTIPWLPFPSFVSWLFPCCPQSTFFNSYESYCFFAWSIPYTLQDVSGWTKFVPQGFPCLYTTCVFLMILTHFGPFLKQKPLIFSHCEQGLSKPAMWGCPE